MEKNCNRHIINSIFALFLIMLAVSCANRRNGGSDQKLRKKSDKELIAALAYQDSIPFDFFTVRIGVDFNSKSQNVSFSCYVKLNVDTAFGGSIKAGPVVIATYKITTDSVTVVNKQPNKCYFEKDLAYLSVLFGTAVEFDFFQELILGLPIGFDPENKYQQIPNDNHYILSSHKKRDYRRLENDRLGIDDDLVLIQYHMDPNTLETYKIDMDIPSDTTNITINYTERKIEDGFNVPEETTIQILNPSDSIFVKLNYGSVKLNEPKKIKIKIPDSYVECP